MSPRPFRFLSLVMAVLSLTAGSLWESALACNVPPPPMNPPPATVRHKTRTKAKIRIKNYKTFGVSAGQFCACGLSTAGLGTIQSVDRVRIVLAGTNTSVPGFSFTPNNVTTASFNSLQPGNWQGFFTQISQAVPEGVATDMVYDVTTTDGSTDDDVVNDLTGGTNGTGPGNADGSVNPDDPSHLGLVNPADITDENFAYDANSSSGTSTFYLDDATNGPLFPQGNSTLQGNPDGLAYIPGLPDNPNDNDYLVIALSPFSMLEVAAMDRDTGILTQNGPLVPSGGVNCDDVTAFPLDGAMWIVDVPHATSNNLAAHWFNPSTGTLTQIQSVPTGPAPQKVTSFTNAASGQRYVAAVNCGNPCPGGLGSVSVFAVNPASGMQTELPGSPFLTGGNGSVWVGVNSTGTLGFTANAGSNDISIAVVDQATGFWLFQGTELAGGMGTSSVAVDPSNQFVIATNLMSGNGTVHTINPDNTLTLTSTFSTGIGPFSVKFGPTGRSFHVPNVFSGNISGFGFDNTTGTATPLAGSPYPAGPGAIKINIVNALAPSN